MINQDSSEIKMSLQHNVGIILKLNSGTHANWLCQYCGISKVLISKIKKREILRNEMKNCMIGARNCLCLITGLVIKAKRNNWIEYKIPNPFSARERRLSKNLLSHQTVTVSHVDWRIKIHKSKITARKH